MATATIEPGAPEILRLIAKIKTEVGALAPVQTTGVPFPFRGIDGVVNHLNAKVNEAGIITVPSVVESSVTARETGNRVVKTAHVRTAFTFYAPDGSSVTATTEGLADDFADRAVAQAQSVAFRVALLQTFFLPTQSPEPEQTGQAVQDYDPAADKSTTPKAVSTAARGTTTKPVQDGNDKVAELREQIKARVKEIKEETGVDVKYAKIGSRLYPKDPSWANKITPLRAVLKAVEGGETE